jgi:hypothetical protein
MDFVVSVEPFSARFYIYQLGFPDSFPAVLQQQTYIGLTRANRDWSILYAG